MEYGGGEDCYVYWAFRLRKGFISRKSNVSHVKTQTSRLDAPGCGTRFLRTGLIDERKQEVIKLPMKPALFAVLAASLLITTACAKKETPPPRTGMDMNQQANPHAGMDMNQSKDPHAGTDMNKSKDPHAGMNMQGAGGMPGMAGMQQQPSAVAGDQISIEGLKGKFPSTWKSVPPASAMRRGQFQIPAAKGDADPGEVSVFYLGPDAGGVEPNIQRWCQQFSQPDGSPTANVLKREEVTVGNLKATIVSFTGSMNASQMPGGPAVAAHDKWMNLSVIVQTPNGPVFFKGTGPEATMKSQSETMKKFIQGLSFAQ